jgi:hypothetical protein
MRIRTIKPEFFTHDGLFEAEKETGLPLRVAFAGLWCAADREGRFRWEPRRLGVQILPYDGLDFALVLDALAAHGFVTKYRVSDACLTRAQRVEDACPTRGRRVEDACFGVIPSFTKHQVINNREADSVFPAPDAENAENMQIAEPFHACPTRAPRVPHATLTCTSGREGKGREQEGKGKEGDTASPPASRFVPPTREQLDLEAAKIGLSETEVTKFVSYYGSNGWKVGKVPMKSWPHALAGWAARWRERAEGQGTVNGNRYGTSTGSEEGF